MKFLLSHSPRCCNHSYSISVYEGDRPSLNNKINNDIFVEGKYENDSPLDLETTLCEIKRRMKENGEDPDSSECREIYNLLYEALGCKQLYISKYTKMIEEIAKNMEDTIRDFYYKASNKIAVEYNGFFEYQDGPHDKPCRTQGFVYQISGTSLHTLKSGQEMHMIVINNGYSCMTSSVPLALFFNQEEADLFETKVNDALKYFSANELDWCNCVHEKHILNDDLKTFKHVNY